MTESVVSGVARKPLGDAANLAFRFGSLDHARILYEELRRATSSSGLSDAAEMATELHLAALSGEHLISATDSPHIASASTACKRSGNSKCDPVHLKELAAMLAKLRKPAHQD